MLSPRCHRAGVGPRPHLEDPGGGELAAEEKAKVPSSAEGQRREGGGHDVRLFTRGHGSEEPGVLELEHAGAEDPLALALEGGERNLEAALGVLDSTLDRGGSGAAVKGQGAALGVPDSLPRPRGQWCCRAAVL